MFIEFMFYILLYPIKKKGELSFNIIHDKFILINIVILYIIFFIDINININNDISKNK